MTATMAWQHLDSVLQRRGEKGRRGRFRESSGLGQVRLPGWAASKEELERNVDTPSQRHVGQKRHHARIRYSV